jgi:hypothetical protein
MKKLIASLTLALIAASPLAGFGQASIETDPAYLHIDKVLDLKAIPPQVNVNLPRFLLKDALSGLTNAPDNPLAKAGIDLPDLLKDVKLIRVVVIEATTNNRLALDKSMKELRAELDGKWTTIVSVPESNVGVYAVGDPAGESMAGIAVLVYDNGEAVIANVVGHISIGKLIKIATQSGKLPKDLLKTLQGISDQAGQQADSKNGGDATTGTTKPEAQKE